MFAGEVRRKEKSGRSFLRPLFLKTVETTYFFFAAGFLAAAGFFAATGFFAAGLAAFGAAFFTAGFAAGFFATAGFAAGFFAAGFLAAAVLVATAGFAAGFFAAGFAAAFLTAGFLAAGFFVAVAISDLLSVADSHYCDSREINSRFSSVTRAETRLPCAVNGLFLSRLS
jgi:hypothetical protein